MTADRGDAFGMELHTVQRPLAMYEPHHQPVISPGGDAHALRQARALDDQRMISGCRKGIGEAFENAGAVMMVYRKLAMYRLGRAHDFSAHGLADRLQPEADAQHRHIAGAAHELEADAGVIGIARTRRDHDALGPHRQRLVDGERVVALHEHLRAEFAEEVPEVVSERVVVVDQQEHGLSHLRYWL